MPLPFPISPGAARTGFKFKAESVHTRVQDLGFSLHEQNCGRSNSNFKAGGLTPQGSFAFSDVGSRCPEFLALTVKSYRTKKSLNHSRP